MVKRSSRFHKAQAEAKTRTDQQSQTEFTDTKQAKKESKAAQKAQDKRAWSMLKDRLWNDRSMGERGAMVLGAAFAIFAIITLLPFLLPFFSAGANFAIGANGVLGSVISGMTTVLTPFVGAGMATAAGVIATVGVYTAVGAVGLYAANKGIKKAIYKASGLEAQDKFLAAENQYKELFGEEPPIEWTRENIENAIEQHHNAIKDANDIQRYTDKFGFAPPPELSMEQIRHDIGVSDEDIKKQLNEELEDQQNQPQIISSMPPHDQNTAAELGAAFTNPEHVAQTPATLLEQILEQGNTEHGLENLNNFLKIIQEETDRPITTKDNSKEVNLGLLEINTELLDPNSLEEGNIYITNDNSVLVVDNERNFRKLQFNSEGVMELGDDTLSTEQVIEIGVSNEESINQNIGQILESVRNTEPRDSAALER